MPKLKSFIRESVLFLLFIFLPFILSGQFIPTEVVRSNEKTIIEGRMYYIHTVQKGQTLFSISKAYEVTQDDILKVNPEIDPANLREGQAIRIPQPAPKNIATYPQDRDAFYSHRVRKGQTVYSLAKKYDVDEELIYEYNPWARHGIQADQTIWIPRRKELQETRPGGEVQAAFFFHTVKETETLYAISLLYGVSVPDIVNSNPILREGLKAGKVLRIPKLVVADYSEAPSPDSVSAAVHPCMDISHEAVTYNVALLLPFFAPYNADEPEIPVDTIAEEGTYVPVHRQQGLRGRNFAEFYEGFLLAVDSLKATGLSVNLHVFDTERDTIKVKRIIRDLSLIQPDLVIGPIYSNDVGIAARLANYQEFNLVSPLSTRSALLEGNPRVFQVMPPREAECRSMAAYLTRFNDGRFILIRGTDSISQHDSWLFKKYLTEHMPVDSANQPLEFRDYNLDDKLMTELDSVLSKQVENIIIVFSESEPDVGRLISRLYMMSTLYPIKLFGLPSWQVWKTIDLTYFHNLQVHLISPFYTDYTNPAVKRYLYRSRMEYGYEPYEISSRGYNFSMLGYDLGFYFLSALRHYGKDFQYCIGHLESRLLLSPYHYVRYGVGGYVNEGFMMIRYNSDFTITNDYLSP